VHASATMSLMALLSGSWLPVADRWLSSNLQ